MVWLQAPYIIIVALAAYIASSICAAFLYNRKGQMIVSTALLGTIAASSLYLLLSNFGGIDVSIINISSFSMLFYILFSLAMMLVNALAYSYSKDYTNISVLLSLSFAGMLLVASANSIVTIFIGLELTTVTTSFMILFEGKHRIEAAVKFFILGSIAITLFSFALAMLLPFDLQLSMTRASAVPNLTSPSLLVLSMLLLIAAFGFDSALFPFNLWIPDVYEGSPTYVTALLAGMNKKVAFVALMEVFFVVFFAYKDTFSTVFLVLSILTMFFGNIIALSQKNVKRMFAYSSISQAGYIAIGIAASTQFGLQASIFYIIAHAFMIIGAFAIVLWLESKNIKTLDDYSGLGMRNVIAPVALTVIMLSMAGIPPLLGFTGKLLLFSSALSANMAVLALLGIVNSFISIYYYARVINSMYSGRAAQGRELKMDAYVLAVVLVCLAVIIIFGLYPQPIIAAASNATSAIFGG